MKYLLNKNVKYDVKIWIESQKKCRSGLEDNNSQKSIYFESTHNKIDSDSDCRWSRKKDEDHSYFRIIET